MTDKENKSPLQIVLQLEEARLGEPARLESIKKSLNTGKELLESDKQYLQEKTSELHKAVEHQMMVDWAIDFVRKLQEKEKKQNVTIDELKKSLEREKDIHKLDKKFAQEVSTKLKLGVEHEKKVKWTLDLIQQLKEAKVGEPDKLNEISRMLRSGQNVEESHKQYLEEKARHLKQIVDCKTKATWSLDAIKKLQQAEIKHSQKLEVIKQAVENGKLVSERDVSYLNARYEKLHRELEHQNKVEWTLETIKKLKEFGVGIPERLEKIKQLLEDEMPVSESEARYLREEYKVLTQMLSVKKKIDWTLGVIKDLQEMEIGNSERLLAIKRNLEARRPVPESEINYLSHKCRLLMIITKKMQKEFEPTNGESKTDEVDYNSILAELNTAIVESEKLQIKVARQAL